MRTAGGVVGQEVALGSPAPAAVPPRRMTPGQQRAVVVSALRAGAGLVTASLLVDTGRSGRLGPTVLAWLLVSSVVVAGAVVVRRPRRPSPRWARAGRWAEPVVAALDVAAFVAVAVTADEDYGYGPVFVLGLVLLVQAPVVWGACGVVLVALPLTVAAVLNPTGLADSIGGRVALVAVVAAAVGLVLALRRMQVQQAAVAEHVQATLVLVFDHSPTPAAIACHTGTLLQVNAALVRLSGLGEDHLVGRRVEDLVHPDDTLVLQRVVASVVAEGARLPAGQAPVPGQQLEVRLITDGGPRWVRLVVGAVPAGRGVHAQVVVQAEDVEERRAVAARLEHEATHDALTGLPNRRAVHRDLERLTARGDGDGGGGALVLVDLDGFKAVNDTLGHEAGDDLLVVVADRLRGALHEGEEAGRLAGDEMVVLADRVHGDAGARELGRRVASALRGPARVAAGEVELSASVGVRRIAAGHDDPASVLRDADAALYRAKRSGGGCWEVAGTGPEDLDLHGPAPEPAVALRVPERSGGGVHRR